MSEVYTRSSSNHHMYRICMLKTINQNMAKSRNAMIYKLSLTPINFMQDQVQILVKFSPVCNFRLQIKFLKL